MKKVLIPVIVFFVIVLGSIIFFINSSFQLTQYTKATHFHINTVIDGGTLETELDGVRTQIAGRNLQRVEWVLDISAKQKIYRKPEINEDEAIYFYFSDSAEYVLAKDPGDSNSVYIFYKYKNMKMRFHLEGYNAWDWATRAVSPEGIYMENIVLD